MGTPVNDYYSKGSGQTIYGGITVATPPVANFTGVPLSG